MQVTLALLVGALALVGVMTGVSLWTLGESRDAAVRARLAAMHETLTRSIAAEAERALSLAQLVAGLPEAQDGLADGARDRLRAAFLPGFDRLASAHGVRQFQFHTAPATSMFRVHMADRFGDDLASFRSTVVEVNRTGQPVSGLEVGRAGLGLRGVVPVHRDGRQVGSVEFGLSFGQAFFDSFTRLTGWEAALYLKTGSAFRRFASTLPDTVRFADDSLRRGLAAPVLVADHRSGAATRAVLLAPITDYRGDAIAVAAVALDRAPLDAAAAAQRGLGLAVGLVVFAAAALGAWVLDRRLSRPLVRLSDCLRQVAGGELDHEVPDLDRADEIGAMATAVQAFKDNAAAQHRREQAERARAAEEVEAQARRHAHERAVADRLRHHVERVAAGELGCRLPIDTADGVHGTLFADVNRLTEVIEQAVTDLGHSLTALAVGNLGHRIDRMDGGRFAEIKSDANATAEKLSRVIGQISECAHAINGVSAELASGSDDLAERTERQAAQVEQTAAAVGELSETVRRNARHAEDASRLSTESRAAAEEGSRLGADAIAAIRDIQVSATRISEFIGVIDEIAFQTNLLALNAAVEAARAGQAGRGFAVVAQEVRQLAQRSAHASREIKGVVQESTQRVDHGVALVQRAVAALSSIATSSTRVADSVSEIADASQAQAGGLDEITAAVGAFDETTQKNAALVEQNSAATRALNDQTAALDGLLAFFVTGRGAQDPMLRNAALVLGTRIDHEVFVERIERAVAGDGSLDPIALADHTACRLGRWYYRDAPPAVRRAPSFAALEAPHIDVHRTGAAVVERLNGGDRAGAQAALDQLHRASEAVLGGLDGLAGDLRAAAAEPSAAPAQRGRAAAWRA